eukprot:1220564-Amphidinium_carterae.1
MGWISACGLIQQAHRNMLLQPFPIGIAADGLEEIRRDLPLPFLERRPAAERPLVCAQVWQIYIDNLDILEVWQGDPD